MNNEELYLQYAEHINADAFLSKNTRSSYLGDVRAYKAFMNGQSFTGATPETVVRLIDYMKENKRANASIHRMVVSVRNLYKFLKAEGLVETNPVKDFNAEKVNALIGY